MGNFKIAFFLNLGFTIFEIFGGIITNSVAIYSDAIHDLGDSLTLGIAWYLEKVSEKGRDKSYSFGFRRFSILGAIFGSLVLILGSTIVIKESIERLISPEPINYELMIPFAVVGIIVNGYGVYRTRKGSGFNSKMISWHLLEDVLGWVAILISSILMILFDLPAIDSVLSILISLVVLWNVGKSLRQSVRIIMQSVPDDFQEEILRQIISEVPEIKSYHDLHVWSLDGEYTVLTCHFIVDSQSIDFEKAEIVKKNIKDKLSKLGINHSTIELEFKPCQQNEC